MKQIIAIPTTNGQLSAHFGHCEKFALVTVEDGEVKETNYITPPPHEPGVLPAFLAQQNANVIIAGGMGGRAQQLFTAENIQVCVGVNAGTPEEIAAAFVSDSLQTGSNLCDH